MGLHQREALAQLMDQDQGHRHASCTRRSRWGSRKVMLVTSTATAALSVAAAVVTAVIARTRRLRRLKASRQAARLPHPRGCTLVPVEPPPIIRCSSTHIAHTGEDEARVQNRGVLQEVADSERLHVVLLPHIDAGASQAAVRQLLPHMLPAAGSAASASAQQGAGVTSGTHPRIHGGQASRSLDQQGHDLLERLEQLPVLGMDAEWEPETRRTSSTGVRASSHQPVSVLQVCGARSCVLLLRPTLALRHMRVPPVVAVHSSGSAEQGAEVDQSDRRAVGAVPCALRKVLEDVRVIKAGVGIKGDCTRLAADFGIHVRGAVDLRTVARAVAPDALVDHTRGAGSGLAGLAAALLSRRMDKAQQCSHWGMEILSQAQLAYAAQDAWLSRHLLLALFSRHLRDTQTLHDKSSGDADHSGGSCPAQLEEEFRAFVAPFIDVHTATTMQQVGKHSHKPRAQQVLGPTPTSSTNSDASLRGMGGENGGLWTAQIRKPARHALRKKQLYENCRLMAPDGKVLCTCSTKKVLWYVERGLGELLPGEPLTVKLRFEPRGRGHADDAYYTSDKENQCVVCGIKTSLVNYGPQYPETVGAGSENSIGASAPGTGHVITADAQTGTTKPVGADAPPAEQPVSSSTQDKPPNNTGMDAGNGHVAPGLVGSGGTAHQGDTATSGVARPLPTPPPPPPPTEAYLRHSIVPHCYRRCFPLGFKSHLSHDIVLMCLPCHQVCGVHDQARMAELGRQYNAPLEHDNQKFKHDQDIAAVRSAARALKNPKVRIPDERRAELQAVVAQHCGLPAGVEPTQQQLDEAADLDPRKPTSEWASHAETVVAALGSSGAAIQEFVQGWRQHFLDSMQPQHLPPYWSVTSRVANSTAHVMPHPPSSTSGTEDDGSDDGQAT